MYLFYAFRSEQENNDLKQTLLGQIVHAQFMLGVRVEIFLHPIILPAQIVHELTQRQPHPDSDQKRFDVVRSKTQRKGFRCVCIIGHGGGGCPVTVRPRQSFDHHADAPVHEVCGNFEALSELDAHLHMQLLKALERVEEGDEGAEVFDLGNVGAVSVCEGLWLLLE